MTRSKTTSKETELYMQVQNLVVALKAFRTTFLENSAVKGTCTMPDGLGWAFERCLAEGTRHGQMKIRWHGTFCECAFQKIYGTWDQIVCYPKDVVTLEDYEQMLFSYWSYTDGRSLDVLGGEEGNTIKWQIESDAASSLEKMARDTDRLLPPLSEVEGCKKYTEKLAKILRNGNPKWMPCRVEWTYIKELDELIKGFELILTQETTSAITKPEIEESRTGPSITPPLNETGQNATPATIINIEKLGVLGDLQAENVQTGDYSSIHKQPTAREKKPKLRIISWIFAKTSHFILTVIVTIFATVIAAIVVDIFADFGWLQLIKEFIHNSLYN